MTQELVSGRLHRGNFALLLFYCYHGQILDFLIEGFILDLLLKELCHNHSSGNSAVPIW